MLSGESTHGLFLRGTSSGNVEVFSPFKMGFMSEVISATANWI
jgi:hypothetical protein